MASFYLDDYLKNKKQKTEIIETVLFLSPTLVGSFEIIYLYQTPFKALTSKTINYSLKCGETTFKDFKFKISAVVKTMLFKNHIFKFKLSPLVLDYEIKQIRG